MSLSHYEQKEESDDHEVLADDETDDFGSVVGSLSYFIRDDTDIQYEFNLLA